MLAEKTENKINANRWFRCIVCMLLVCCFLFQVATPKAQAVAVVDDLAIGITALLLLAAAGIVFTPKDSDGIAAIGNSFKSSMYQWGTSAEKLDEVEEWFTDLTLYQPSDPGNEGDEDPRFEVRLARGILSGIAVWIASVCLELEMRVEKQVGDVVHNGITLPSLPADLFDFVMITYTNDKYTAHSFEVAPEARRQSSSYNVYILNGQDYKRYECIDPFNEWSNLTEFNDVYGDTMIFGPVASTVIWSNFDLFTSSGTLVYDGVESYEIIQPSALVGDLPDQLQSGEKDADDIVLPGVIDYGVLIQDGMTLEESVIDTMTQLSDGALSYDDYIGKTLTCEQPVFTQNLPLIPDMTYTYAIGEQADTFTVEATGNSDGSGTLTYEWLDTSTVPYTVLGTGQSFTPDTSQVTDYSLACRVTNTVPCSLVDGGYLYNSAYSWSYQISVSDTTINPPESTTPSYSDKLDDLQQGIESIPGQVTDGLQDVLDNENVEAENKGQEYVDQITGLIPNESQGFVAALGSLASALSYNGTECVLPIPALTLPAIKGLFPSYTVMEAQEVDLEEFFHMMPAGILLLVQSLLTAALIAYCFKELYDVVAYFFVLKGGNK